MAATRLTRKVRRRLSSFAHQLASPFTDSRRRRFLTDMLQGLVISGHVHLTKIARAIGSGSEDIHGVEKRLSRNLASKHWDPSPLADALLRDSAARITDDSLLVGDLTDLAKYYAQKLEGLGRVHDGSDPEKRTAPGYMLFEAYVRVGRWQLFPLVLEPLKVYSGAATSENREILQHVQRIQQATGGKGTWLWDRGADRDELMLPWLEQGVAFVIRQRGDRHVVGSDGRVQAETAWAAEWQPRIWPRPWPRRGYTTGGRVFLPEAPAHELLLVVHWRRPGSEPLLLLVSPQGRRPGRQAKWFAKAYRQRWGVEDATWGIKQRFHLESFLVRSWRSLCRLLWLVAWAFVWLNLWGEDRFGVLREALLEHPWRLAKKVTYLFDWIALQIGHLLHPRPKFDVQRE
jgi:hypothetical protein